MADLCRTLEILKKAKSRIEKGWIKGNLRIGDKNEKVCSVGAIIPRFHLTLTSQTELAGRYVFEALPVDIQDKWNDHWVKFRPTSAPVVKYESAIITFNDAPKTTERDVLDVFDRAIKAVVVDVEQENERTV